MYKRPSVNIESWKQKTIGEFLAFQRGHDLTQEERKIGSIPVFGAAGQNGYHNKAIAKGPGIVIGRSGGSFGQVHFVKEDFWPHNTALYVVDYKGNDPGFAYYLLKLLDFSSLNSGSAQPSLNRNFLYPIPVKVPGLIEQRRISKILSVLDNKIELNKKINVELETMAKTIYDFWFVQFDFPDKKGKPYKSSGGKMIWNAVLEREIPEGWTVSKMSQWIDNEKSGDWGKEESEGNFTRKVVCFRGTDINGLNGLAELNPPVRYILEKNSFKILKAHDLIIEISGGSPIQSTGRLAFITDTTIKRFKYPLICSNFCKPISLKNKKLLYNFVYYWNSLYDNGVFFDYESKTSGIKNLLFDNFINSYYTVVPNEKIVTEFYDFMENVQNKKQANLTENQKLIELRDWLLPMLINGQIGLEKSVVHGEEMVSMATELITDYNKVAKLNIPKSKAGFAKQVLAGKIISLFREDRNFTHIKFQKLQFLAEHIAEADLNLNYYFQTAGPYDNRFMHTIADSFRKSKWFDERKYKFIPLNKQNEIEDYYKEYFCPVLNRLKKLFELLAHATVAEVEIIATAYAVWNNRILLKQPTAESLLMEDFYNWSDRKHRYTEKQILEGVHWLQQNDFVPKGFGKEIKRAKYKLQK